MAKVHKARKSNKKYSFQRKKISKKALLIILAVALVAVIGLKIAYDNYVSGEIAVTAPSNELLNNIAANWRKIEADTENFMNPYAATTTETTDDTAATDEVVADGTDGNGGAYLHYIGNENIDSAYIYVNAGELVTDDDTVETSGEFARATLSGLLNGSTHWGHAELQLQVANANCYIVVYDADPETIDESAMTELLNAVEAALAAE